MFKADVIKMSVDWKDFKTSGNVESLIHFYDLTLTLWKYKRKIEQGAQCWKGAELRKY